MLNSIEATAKNSAAITGQNYIVIVYDAAGTADRSASFVSNVAMEDVSMVCDAVTKQIKAKYA